MRIPRPSRSILTSLALALLVGTPLFAQAPVPGQPASIVLKYFDPDTGQEVNVPGTRFVQPASRLRVEAVVYDAYGARANTAAYPCTVEYEVWNNFAGSRQSGILSGQFIDTTDQMGPFQVGARCKENPQVRASPDQMTVSTSSLAPRYGAEAHRMAAAQRQAALTGGKQGGGGLSPGAMAGIIGGTVLGVGAIAAGLSAASTTTTGGGGTCSLRFCLRSSISGCQCSTSTDAALCQFPVTTSGGACTNSSGFTIARCPSGTSCTNGTCNTTC